MCAKVMQGKNINVRRKAPEFPKKTEWNMAAWDFERIHTILCAIDEFAIRLGQQDANFIRPFFNSLCVLYRNMKPLLSSDKQTEIDNKMVILSKAVDGAMSVVSRAKTGKKIFPTKVNEDLNKFHEELLILRQGVGLGFRVEIEEKRNPWV